MADYAVKLSPQNSVSEYTQNFMWISIVRLSLGTCEHWGQTKEMIPPTPSVMNE